MEQPPPLTPHEASQFSGREYAQLGQPQTIKVFGIIHMVLGCYGVLTASWTLYTVFVGNPLLKLGGSSASPEMQLQIRMQNDLQAFTTYGAVVMVVVTALILYAGLLLLKGRKNALKWSNAYAGTSIVTKIISFVLMLIYVLPMVKQIFTEMGTSGSPMISSMQTMMTVTMICSGLIPLIYPILTLILLNRPNVKTWFANQPA